MRLVIATLALGQLLAGCAPDVGRVTMAAIVAYESADRPFAIGDNTERRTYFPHDRSSALRLATRLLRSRHNIDVGYTQINSANFSRLGLGLTDALDPCTNVASGARILAEAYRGAVRRYGPGQLALVHALSAYNTGGYFAGLTYARGVYAAAARIDLSTAEPK